MTSLFRTVRFTALFFGFVFATIVLGLAANFAHYFLPLHRDFLIFALTASAITMVFIIVISLRSTPSWEVFVLAVFAVLWCAMGGYSTDVIGHVECDSLYGRIPAAGDMTYSSEGYCRQMKVIQAFSWAEFALFVILFLVVLNLGLGATARGYNEVWNGSISDLGWYGEETGHRDGLAYGGGGGGGGGGPNGSSSAYPLSAQQLQQQGVSYTYPNVQTFGGSQPVYQLPGHSVVITNGPNGAQVTQIPVEQVQSAPRSMASP